jgi:hypothetical protein
MESSVVSLVLAQALVTLPKIIMADLYVKCEGQIGNVTLAQFKVTVASWLKDKSDPNHIPGYECRKGPQGGIYKIGSKTVSNTSDKEKVSLDPAPVAEFICGYLETHPRITVKDLIPLIDIAPLTEVQFKKQMSDWLNDGHTFPLFESRMGPTGGIYLIGAEMEKFIPIAHEPSEDGSEPEHVGGFAVQITRTLKVTQADERNWVIQKLTGNTWVNKGYHADIAGCLKSVVKHAMNGEFNLSNNLVQLNDLAAEFSQMEGRLMAQVEKHVAVHA